jgi:hypothetical protein
MNVSMQNSTRPLLRGWLASALLTAGVQVLAYLALSRRAGSDDAAMPALLLATLWIVLAAPMLAASGSSRLSMVCRGGGCVDGSLVLLCVLAGQGHLAWLSVLKLYVLWLTIACAEIGCVAMAASLRRRVLLAALAGLVVLILGAGPFWTNGILNWPDAPRERAAWLVRAVNPVFAVASAAQPIGFIWQESPILYGATVLGRDIPLPAAGWEKSAAIFALAAVACWAVALIRESFVEASKGEHVT